MCQPKLNILTLFEVINAVTLVKGHCKGLFLNIFFHFFFIYQKEKTKTKNKKQKNKKTSTPPTITPMGQLPLFGGTITPEEDYPHLRNIIFFT